METNAVVGILYAIALVIAWGMASRKTRKRGRHAATR